jgi:hypothetical protein
MGMSKQSKRKARLHKRKVKRVMVTCPSCGAADDGSESAILQAIADSLNLAADKGIRVRLHHGIAEVRGKSRGGYILPLRDGRWTPRDQHYDRLVQVFSLDDDLD